MVVAGLAIAFAGAPAGAQDNAIEGKVAVCNACHGANGMPADPKSTPIIWGQQVSFLVKQLSDYRNGARENPIMTPIAKTLQQADLRPIAVYFAAKTWPPHSGNGQPGQEPGKIAMCKICHQPNFEGGAPAPRLAGQSFEFLSAQMSSFADGKRTNNGDMPQIMQTFSQDERTAMAHYLAGL
jgi:cytochrome c553